MTRIIPVISGSRRVGKTTICVNMAYHMAQKGMRTCLVAFDSQAGQPISGVGLPADNDLDAVLSGKMNLPEIVVRSDFGVDIVSANLGRALSDDAAMEKMSQLNLYMGDVFDAYDVVLLDPPSGITRQAVACALASPEVFVVMTPDDNAVEWAHDLLAVLNRNGFNEKVNVVVNRGRNDREGEGAFTKLRRSADERLGIALGDPIDVAGDPMITEAHRRQLILGKAFPDAPSLKGIYGAAARIADSAQKADAPSGGGLFWEQLSMIAQFPLDFSGVKEDGTDLPSESPSEPPPEATAKSVKGDAADAPVSAPPVETRVLAHPSGNPSRPVQTVVSGGTLSVPGMDEAVRRLAEGIENISQELSALRRIVETRSPHGQEESGPEMQVERIPLDFERYRAARKASALPKKENAK